MPGITDMKYKGRELAHPVTIIRRLAVLPVLHILRILFCAVMVLGWGYDDAEQAWKDMPL